MLNQDNNINRNKEESVDELLSKLAKKGKRVKLLDGSESVKELPKQDEFDTDDLEREANGPRGSTKKKMD